MLENKQVAPAFSVANQENNIIHLADFLWQKNHEDISPVSI